MKSRSRDGLAAKGLLFAGVGAILTYIIACAVAEGRLQNDDIFSFFRSFGGSLETLLDNSDSRED